MSFSRGAPAFAKLLAGRRGALALDSSCGFGAKTFALAQLGVDVYGSDGSAFAIAEARELAAAEGVNLEYFVSTWAELPERTSLRFDGVLNDALSWITSEAQFREAIAGIRDVLTADAFLMSSAREAKARPAAEIRFCVRSSRHYRSSRSSGATAMGLRSAGASRCATINQVGSTPTGCM